MAGYCLLLLLLFLLLKIVVKFLLQLLIVICCCCHPARAVVVVVVVVASAIAIDCCLLLHHHSNHKTLALVPKFARRQKTGSLQLHYPPTPHCNDTQHSTKSSNDCQSISTLGPLYSTTPHIPTTTNSDVDSSHCCSSTSSSSSSSISGTSRDNSPRWNVIHGICHQMDDSNGSVNSNSGESKLRPRFEGVLRPRNAWNVWNKNIFSVVGGDVGGGVGEVMGDVVVCGLSVVFLSFVVIPKK